MSEHQPNPASAAGDDLEQMTPNQRRALNKALAALETMAALWASEIRLTDLSKRIADVPDAAERAKRIAAFVEQGFIEGAYRHYLDHKDQIEALATDRAQATGLVDQHHRDSAELRKLCAARDQARRTAEYWKAEHNAANKRIAALEAQIATVAPAVDAQPVGEIAHNEIDGFHFAPSVHWLKIGIGTKLYATPQSEGLRKDADLSLRALYEDACIQANKNAQDAARWRYAVRHWLDEHIATKQADEAIAALSKQDPQ